MSKWTLYFIFIIIISFSLFYLMTSLVLDQFESVSAQKVLLVEESVNISVEFLEQMRIYSNQYYEGSLNGNRDLLDQIEYNEALDIFSMDNMDESFKRSNGNITGIGNLAETKILEEDLILALSMNPYIHQFHSENPDITWIYYMNNDGFINLFPWAPSSYFTYNEASKEMDFYRLATPEVNPDKLLKWTPVYLDGAGKGLMVTLSLPVYEGERFTGALSVDITNERLNELVNSHYKSYLVDNYLDILASSLYDNENAYEINSIQKFSKETYDQYQSKSSKQVNMIGFNYVFGSKIENTPWMYFSTISILSVYGISSVVSLPVIVIGMLLFVSVRHNEARKKIEIELKNEKELMKNTLLALNNGIITTDVHGIVTLMNHYAARITGYDPSYAIGRSFDVIFNALQTDMTCDEDLANPVEQVLLTGETMTSPEHMEVLSRTGELYYISGTISPTFNEKHAISGVVVSFVDITKEYEQESEIQTFLDINLEMLCVTNFKGDFIKVNKKFEDVLGYSSEELYMKNLLKFIHKEDVKKIKFSFLISDEDDSLNMFICRFIQKSGEYRYLEWHSQLSHNKYYYSSIRDVTERYMYDEELKKVAYKDKLTGLFNRHYLEIVIDNEMRQSDETEGHLTMILADIDFFKRVNDQYGHPVGDEVLIQLSRIMNETIRTSDVLIRFGGEEFVVFMPNTNLEGGIIAAEKIRQLVEKSPFPIESVLTISCGVAQRHPMEGFKSWYERLDKNLYRAKESGRNKVCGS